MWVCGCVHILTESGIVVYTLPLPLSSTASQPIPAPKDSLCITWSTSLSHENVLVRAYEGVLKLTLLDRINVPVYRVDANGVVDRNIQDTVIETKSELGKTRISRVAVSGGLEYVTAIAGPHVVVYTNGNADGGVGDGDGGMTQDEIDEVMREMDVAVDSLLSHTNLNPNPIPIDNHTSDTSNDKQAGHSQVKDSHTVGHFDNVGVETELDLDLDLDLVQSPTTDSPAHPSPPPRHSSTSTSSRPSSTSSHRSSSSSSSANRSSSSSVNVPMNIPSRNTSIRPSSTPVHVRAQSTYTPTSSLPKSNMNGVTHTRSQSLHIHSNPSITPPPSPATHPFTQSDIVIETFGDRDTPSTLTSTYKPLVHTIHTSLITAAVYVHGMRGLVTATEDGEVKVVDVAGGRVIGCDVVYGKLSCVYVFSLFSIMYCVLCMDRGSWRRVIQHRFGFCFANEDLRCRS